ncbi:hypothetical protein [Streptomyces sp. RFCAC02]|uniref:hypothetical protein n=1 Tax=Streptomyces sp. RFCAC02 TaxID=2499143 RepID=UPI00320A60A5
MRALGAWLSRQSPGDIAEPFTFTVATDGVLRLAPRRSEHVVCAGGVPVLGAGEIGFAARPGGGWEVAGITNQSTGYCPGPGSWTAVESALDTAGIPHPGHFTHVFVFRRCAHCGHRNIVRDDHFYCAICDAALPSSDG